MASSAPRSFRDPAYDDFDRSAAARVGIPADLLIRIRTRGERSNADQISSAGARTVYQITPATRRAVLKKYGVDAYLGPQQAAIAAAHVLKEGMDRNGGSQREAVAEYHAGTDRRNRGPVNRAYVARVTGGSKPTETTYERMRARKQAEAEQTPSIAKVYDAYRAGRMTAADRADFERDVAEGRIILPRGAKVRARDTSAPTELPRRVAEAYNNGDMSASDRAELDADIRRGVVKLPQGVKLETPGAKTAGEGFGVGVRNVATGVGGLLDLVAGPLNSAVNALPGEQGLSPTPFRDVADKIADVIGLSRPETKSERLLQAITEGGTQALATAGVAGAVAPLTSAASTTGNVARSIAANPVRDVISGVSGGAGAYAGSEIGGAPGAVIGGLAGGFAGASATSIAERLVARIPRSAVLDEAGNLTDNGREVILRTGADPAEVQQAYARRRGDADGPRPRRQSPEEAAAARAAASGRAREALADPETRARVIERPPAPPASRQSTDISAQTDRIVRAIGDRIPPPRPPADAETPTNPDEPVGTRFAEAQSEGVRLTRGQAERNFEVQNDENSLRVSASAEGEQARQFFNQQNEQISDAATRFRAGFGDIESTAAERGEAFKQAISDLRDAGAAGVTRLYREAEALGGNGLKLDTAGIRSTATDILIDEAVPDGVKRAVSQELARYGLIGKASPTNEAGITKVTLDDGSSVSVRGPIKELTVANAEDLRKAVNRLYDPTRPKLSAQGLKGAIDDAVEEAVEKAARDAPEGRVGEAYRKARDAHVEQKRTFSAKDVIQSLVDNRKGTGTPVVLPERAVAAILGSGKDAVTNLRKVKVLLLSSRQPSAQQAWRAIQAQALANIFDQATNVQTGNISGARLNTAISKFGTDKLRVLLTTQDFNQLMKLRRIIADATIPMSGTTNPSGTFTKLVNFLRSGMLRFVPGSSVLTDAASALLSKAKDLAAARKTLVGITSYDGRQATARRMDQEAREFVEQFIRDGGGGRLMPTAVNLASAPSRQGEQ